MVKTKAKKNAKANIVPLLDRVLVKELKAGEGEKVTASGIIIPENVSEDKGAKKGTVIAVGEGRYDDGKFIKPKVKAGDTVLFQWGDMLKIDGEEYYIVREESVLAIIK